MKTFYGGFIFCFFVFLFASCGNGANQAADGVKLKQLKKKDGKAFFQGKSFSGLAASFYPNGRKKKGTDF